MSEPPFPPPGAADRPALPYFDRLLPRLEAAAAGQEASLDAQLFGRHVHWGYWPDPASALGTPADFADAAEALCALVCQAARVESGQAVLDVGCGVGGTLMHLNAQHRDLSLTGLNIDPRQLAIARRQVQPLHGNRVCFVEGDACRLPFADASFDVVLAVECIFHFGSRRAFLAEVARVLRPGGRLALSDFVASEALALLSALPGVAGRADERSTYGSTNVVRLRTYQRLARELGWPPFSCRDITAGTLPTYPVLLRHSLLASDPADRRTNRLLQALSRLGLLRYLVLEVSPHG
ncbi:MAG: class I SAM-dependent methyltransferase [Synechococcaceae cyanobacterium]|nr:class I SAM-dependent methyltransferase [Synechococcaceae cyanobacterium]